MADIGSINGISIPSGAGAATPKMTFATIYEGSGRFTAGTGGTGAITYSGDGVIVDTGSTGTSYANNQANITPFEDGIEIGSPTFSINLRLTTMGSDFESLFGIGNPGTSGTSITYTGKSIGFKIVRASSGDINLYATQGDGTTQNASSVLTTLALGENVELTAIVNGTSSVDYYYRVDGGALSSATNLTSNMPVGANGIFSNSVSNVTVASATKITVSSISYAR